MASQPTTSHCLNCPMQVCDSPGANNFPGEGLGIRPQSLVGRPTVCMSQVRLFGVFLLMLSIPNY